MIDPANMFFYVLILRIFGNHYRHAQSPDSLKNDLHALAFHSFKILRLFDRKNVAVLQMAQPGQTDGLTDRHTDSKWL